jgi:hypothetical protein
MVKELQLLVGGGISSPPMGCGVRGIKGYPNLRCIVLVLAACRRILVPQALPGNAHREALPPDKTSGRAAEMPLPGRTWERVSKKFCSLRQTTRY